MLTPAQDWFQQQTPRDQLVLKIGAAALGAFLLIFVLIKPQIEAHSRLAKKLGTTTAQLHWMQNNLHRFGVKSKPGQTGGSPTQIVTRSASRLGITLARVQPKSKGRLGLWIDDVTTASLLNWLQQLASQGLNIDSIQISQTGILGHVKVNLTVVGRR